MLSTSTDKNKTISKAAKIALAQIQSQTSEE
jgi:hypothetical protein